MTLTYDYTQCDCHPETCCCPAYSVFCDGVLLAKVRDKAMAEKLCEFVPPTKEGTDGQH